MLKIMTTDGKTVVKDKDDKGNVRFTPEQLEASCKDRNERAEQMGLKVRYEIISE